MTNRAYSVIHVKAMDEDQRVIRGIATSPRPDRVGDVVEPMGVKVASDVPLFLYHDGRQTVGRAKFGRPTPEGIPFEASIPNVTEPGVLKDRVDEAWQMVKYQLITAVSIGFRVLGDAYENLKGGGLRFLETEVLELSLVPVPAQPDAVISGFKSMDSWATNQILTAIKSADQALLRAASGAKQKGVVRLTAEELGHIAPGVSGQKTRRKGAVYLH